MHYRVVKKTDKMGREEFFIQYTNSRFRAIFGLWDTYKSTHTTIDYAIARINRIDGLTVTNKEIVYKKTTKIK